MSQHFHVVQQSIEIGVVIPTADRPTMLERALQSVSEQTFRPDKVLVIDNGKVPLTRPPEAGVEVIRIEPRSGASRSRNVGAGLSRSSFLAFLDDDDVWHRDYLLHMSEAAIRNAARVVVGKLDRLNEGELVRSYKLMPADPIAQRSLYYKNPGFGGQNILLERSFFELIGGFDERLPASVDRDLAVRILQAGEVIHVAPKAIAILCDHSGTRVRGSQVRGNWMFIRKHWSAMSAIERMRALRTLSVRWARLNAQNLMK